MLPELTNSEALTAIAEALLIGLLIGAQRETSEGIHPGLRDFLSIGLAGGICGLLQSPWLTVAALISISGLLAVFHFEEREARTGITTELAGVGTFCLAYLSATPPTLTARYGAPLAVGTTIVIVAFLEMKKFLQKLVRETITESEFNDTLRFLAVVLVIYPLLPNEQFGTAEFKFFNPHQVWLFVILISSISYIGYFLQKFMGAEKGLEYTSVLGGLASTSAATLAFARCCKAQPDEGATYWRATVLANTVQFPRTIIILYLVNADLAWICLPPLLTMLAAAALLAFLLRRRGAGSEPLGKPMSMSNPFRLKPALEFGAMLTAVIFLSKLAAMKLGSGALFGTSALGGLVDVATVAVSMANLLAGRKVGLPTAEAAVLLALATNVSLKLVLATVAGTRAFAWRMAASYVLIFSAGGLAWWISNLV